jgi:hypothetical protein
VRPSRCARAPSPAVTHAIRLTLVVVAAGLAGLCGLSRLAAAQQRVAGPIAVAPLIRALPASRTRLAIKVGALEASAKNSFVRLKGLPSAASLSEGYAIAPGSWAVPLNALTALEIILPEGVQGSSEILISLVNAENGVLGEIKTSLVIGPSVEATVPAPARGLGAAMRIAPEVNRLSPAERERLLGLHIKGREQLDRGNIYAARKFFERAADAGLPESAFALAATYDADELAKLKTLGLQPDPDAARKWYEKARQLGSPEAIERLRLLGPR